MAVSKPGFTTECCRQRQSPHHPALSVV